MTTRQFERDRTRLAYVEFGGDGPPILLVHGLAGHAGEWRHCAEALLHGGYSVFALDQRGHGASERDPADMSRAAFVEDCAATIGELGRGPVTLIGQSMGASTALLTAAAHPELVRSLVVIEGSPDGPEPPDPNPPIAADIREWLSAWPVPFADERAALDFFESERLDARAWTDGLERTRDGLAPRFVIERLVECMRELGSRSYWEQWRSISCPILIVAGEHGSLAPGHQQELVAAGRRASCVTLPGAGHDVHLDAPEALIQAVVEWAVR